MTLAVPALAQADSEPEKDERPEGVSFGFGAGYDLRNASLLNPTAASIRFQLNRSFTFEPFLRAISDKRSQEVNREDESDIFDTRQAIRSLEFGMNTRYRFTSRGKVDLVAVVGVAASQQKNDPRGPDNTAKSLFVAMEYGFGAEYWFNKNWCLSATGNNARFQYSEDREFFGSDGDSFESSRKFAGFTWAPRMDVAFHLYY